MVESNSFYIISIPLFIVIFTLFCTYVAYFNISNTNSSYIRSLGRLWQRGPILTINPTNKKDCNKDEIVLIHDDWLGTSEGCDCTNNADNGYIRAGECKKQKNANEGKCKSIQSTPELIFQYWGDSLFCGKRMGNYFDLLLVEKNEQCPLYTKRCGIIDSIGNILCVSTVTECPINKIIFNNGNKSEKMENATALISFSTNKTAQYSNMFTDNYVLGDIKVDENIPCLFPSNENLIYQPFQLANVLSKKLNVCASTNKGFSTDSKTYEIDSMSKKDFYILNGVENNLSQLPSFTGTPSDQIEKIYGKTLTGLTIKCRKRILDKYSPKKFIQLMQYSGDLIDFAIHRTNNAAIMTVIALGIMLFCIVIIIGCNFFWDVKNINNRQIPKFYVLIATAVGLSSLIFTGSALYIISKLSGLFNILSDKCSDDATNDIISDMISYIDLSKTAILLAFISSAVLFILPGIAVIQKKTNKTY